MWHQHVHERNERDKRPRDLFDPTDRIAKLIRLLSSPVDGEVVNAARALDRVLAGAGGFHHLAEVVEANWYPQPPPKPKPPPEPKHDWQIMAAHLLKYRHVLLGSRELDFLQNMQRSRTAPTDKQWKWLGDIEARLPPGQRMASLSAQPFNLAQAVSAIVMQTMLQRLRSAAPAPRRRLRRKGRGERPPFNFSRARIHEIARVVMHRHGELPDTDDCDVYLDAVAAHLDPSDYLRFAARCGVTLAAGDIAPPRKIKADTLAQMLRITNAEREDLALRTIGACDVSKAERTKRRKAKDRERKRARRMAVGAIPRDMSLSRTRPWEREGISRRTWYRRRQMLGTNSSAILLSSFTADELVPPPPTAAASTACEAGHDTATDTVSGRPNTAATPHKRRHRGGGRATAQDCRRVHATDGEGTPAHVQ
jgi:hypothetical protein